MLLTNNCGGLANFGSGLDGLGCPSSTKGLVGPRPTPKAIAYYPPRNDLTFTEVSKVRTQKVNFVGSSGFTGSGTAFANKAGVDVAIGKEPVMETGSPYTEVVFTRIVAFDLGVEIARGTKDASCV